MSILISHVHCTRKNLNLCSDGKVCITSITWPSSRSSDARLIEEHVGLLERSSYCQNLRLQ